LLGPVLIVSSLLVARAAGFQEPDAILEIDSNSLTAYQASATGVQDISPQVLQRGVGIDGGLRSPTAYGMAIAANLYRGGCGDKVGDFERLGPVSLATGSYVLWDVDLALPSDGPSFVVGRSYNAVQNDGSHHTSLGYQGANFFQIAQPELAFYDGDANKEATDLVYGADRFVEYKRVAADSDIFRGVNGAAGVIEHQPDATGEPDLYVLTDQRGVQYTFFGDDGDAGSAQGQLWKIVDPDDNTIYVGDSTTASTAITNGFTGGRFQYVYDAYSDSNNSDGRRYTFTYDGNDRLIEVKAENKTGGTWSSPTGVTTVAEVDYTYYDGSTSYGSDGDLEFVKVTVYLSDSGVSAERRINYRYYKGAYDAETNPGHDHALKYVYGFEGVRGYDWTDSDISDADLRNASNPTLEPYAQGYFEYDSSHRISKAWFDGACNCSGAANGTHTFAYESNGGYSDGSGYDEDEWMARAVVKHPDGTYVTQYLDEAGQALSRVITDADPDNTNPAPDFWATYVDRNASGIVVAEHTPANVSGYTHSTASFTTSTSAGLVWRYVLVGSGNTEEGFVSDRKYQTGTSGSQYLAGSWEYGYASYQVDGSESKSQVVRPVRASERRYTQAITSGTTGSNLTQYATTYHGASGRLQLAIKEVETTLPAVSAGNNGSGSSETRKVHYEKDGTLSFEKSPSGLITYREYTNGQLTKVIRDADTTKSGSGQDFEDVTIPTGFSSSGTPLHHVTAMSYDAQGRLLERTADDRTERHYYTRLSDLRLVELVYKDYDSGTPTYYGPVRYTVSNHAGQVEVEGVVALSGNQTTTAQTAHIDETDSDPITAVDLGTVAQLQTRHYTEAGSRLEEERLYFSVPTSLPGTEGTHYDATLFGYDDSGRRWRQKDATGTIHRTVFDDLGRVSERWIGTNDSSFSGGESSGTDNMVKTEALEYDSGNDQGNSYLTKRTLYVEASDTDKRETTYTYDVRGHLLLETRPLAPHAFHKVDNLGRRVATGLFSSTASIVVGTDDPTTETTNRLALEQTFYDEMGRVWKTQRHEIDVADGSDDDNLQTLTWYDAEGRRVKTDGESGLEKTAYDRLGRRTHRFVLASDNDTAYADADDVTGDMVLEEHQTRYDASDGKVILEVSILRYEDDTGMGATTGALDTNTDGDDLKVTASDLEGRPQITLMWNGLQGVANVVAYGTNGGSDLDRDGLSVPAGSTTRLRTDYAYNTDGTLQKVTDPRGKVTKWEYDAAGRKTKEIRNYDVSVNSGNPSGTDDNVTVTYAYTDGLMTSMTADLPAGETDQTTTYTYGTTKGTSAGDSKIATGHLLQKVTYPDSAGGTDVVTYAYNALGEKTWEKDQAGNVTEVDHDDLGREAHLRITTLISGFDGAVRRVTTSYTSRGPVEKVTQYDNATVGSGNVVNEVKYTYDGWGNVVKFEQDRDSAVGATGSVNDYEVSYTYAKATGGRNTVSCPALFETCIPRSLGQEPPTCCAGSRVTAWSALPVGDRRVGQRL
jgi:YD repeat-containing protein